MKAAEVNIILLQERLPAIESRAAKSNDQWLATSLLKSAHRAYIHLRHGWSEDTTHSAWACRNLLELRIMTKYILQSSAERRRFVDDMYLDAIGYTQATKTISAQLNPELDLQDHDSMLKILEARKVKRQFTEKTYVPVRFMASEVGLLSNYEAMNKVCSKMVHPTSLSVLSIDLEEKAQANRDLLLLAGCIYLNELVTDIIPFAESLTRAEEPPHRIAGIGQRLPA